ncbi:hypothetical protein L2E82_44662 [Cichorium intybus]|uniref:Uncharacterized protein n=1 Tax=Cichorium intybus TaxID=13427 RepID=A0ACB8ZR63_CICIN|nr:hypothetical protein L2E82_44662 [Cichorium intybus]
MILYARRGFKRSAARCAAKVKIPNSDLNAYIKGPSPRVRVFGSFLDQRRQVSTETLWFQGFGRFERRNTTWGKAVVDREHFSVFQKQGVWSSTDACPLVAVVWRVRLLPCISKDKGKGKSLGLRDMDELYWESKLKLRTEQLLLRKCFWKASITESTGFTLESRVVNQSPRKSSSWVDRSDPGFDIETVAHFRMAVTRSNGGPGAGASSGGGPTDENLRNLIAEEVSREVLATIPQFFGTIKAELWAMFEERLATQGTSRARDASYKDFSACSPPMFDGGRDPIVSMRWISVVEDAFRTCSCPENSKVTFAANLLRDGEKDWWEIQTKDLTPAHLDAITWPQFKEQFKLEYVLQVEMERLAQEYLNLIQTTETMTEITKKFNERALFCPEFAATERMRMRQYLAMLRTDIREFVSATRHQTLTDMIAAARARELELETQQKQKRPAPTQTQQVSKKFRGADQGKQGQRSQGKCGKCGRNHEGHCWVLICHECGKEGHYAKDCRQEVKICFNCNQVGHFKAQCPRLTQGVVQNPAPTTLRITDGRQGKGEAPKTKGRAFVMTAEEAQDAPDVVTGTFLVNSTPTFALFDSGASHSFVSAALGKCFGIALGTLHRPLEVEIADDKTVKATSVYRGCEVSMNHGSIVRTSECGFKPQVGERWLCRAREGIEVQFSVQLLGHADIFNMEVRDSWLML